MNTFDRHIIQRFTSGIVFLMATLVVFFIILHYVENADDFHTRGATFRMIFFQYYVTFIPEIMKLTSPLAVFLAGIYVMGRLTQEMQIFALQTSGVSLYRLLVPFLAVGILVTGGMFWFNGWIVPIANKDRLVFESQYLSGNSGYVESNNIHRQNNPGEILIVGYFDREAGTAYRVSLQSFDESARITHRLDGQSMSWQDSTETWEWNNVVIRSFDNDGFERRRKVAAIDTVLQVYPRDLARTARDAEAMTIPEAANYVESLQRSGAANIGRPLVEYHTKYAYPFTNLILILLAIPIAAVRRSGGQAVRMAIGLFVAFIYLALIKLTEPFGYSGQLDPITTTWLPHILFLVFGLVFLVKTRK